MKDIFNYCMRVNGIETYYPAQEQLPSKILESNSEGKMKYNQNNGKVAFINEDGSYYVTPFFSEVIEELKKAGYTQGGVYVPFSNGDIPRNKELAEKWEELCSTKRIYRETGQFPKTIEKKSVNSIPGKVYQMSLRIPEEGIEVNIEDKYKTVIKPVPKEHVSEYMGTYYTNSGNIAFVDNQGDTYVSPFSYEVAELLDEANYAERRQNVPFSFGEKISDPRLAIKWEEMYKTAREEDRKRRQENDSSLKM